MNRFFITIILIAACAVSAAVSAENSIKNSPSNVVTTPQVRAELLAFAPDGVGVGKTVWVGLQIEHQPEWHTYWKNSGDSGQPTDLQFTLPAGVQAGEIAWGVPQKIWIGRLANYGYEGKMLLPVPLEISSLYKPDLLSPDLTVKLKAVWLVCKKECIPEEGEFSIKIPAKSSTALHKTAFDAAFALHPKNLNTPAVAKIAAQNLEFQIPNLPAELQKKKLQVFPETPEVVNNGAKEGVSEGAREGGDWSQSWQGDVWTAKFPLSEQRSASPKEMVLVLTADGKTAWRVTARVEGTWGALAAPATVSPQLAQALKENSQSTGVSVKASTNNDLASFAPALLFALLGGMILNLMPCVFPVLAIKVLGFANTTNACERRAGGWAYSAGVVLSFLALGGLMLALRAGGQALGWGFQLQSPAVVAALALLFTLIGLNLLGVFEFASVLPSSLATVQAKSAKVDAFLSGVLAVAVASPCTAPFMGASLGFALGLPAWQALLIFAALGLGMALPYLAASLIPALAGWLPRPGAWMEVFKCFMAFPMFATVVWLLWVIGQQNGIDGAASLLLLLLALSMCVWALNLSGKSRKIVATFSIAVCACLAWVFGQNVIKNEPVLSSETSQNAKNSDIWQKWTLGKAENLVSQGKPVFVDFTAAWCVTCQANKKTVLNQPEILQAFEAKKVQLLRADWTKYDPEITKALNAFGRSGVPVYVFYKPGAVPVVLSEILTLAQIHAEIAKL